MGRLWLPGVRSIRQCKRSAVLGSMGRVEEVGVVYVALRKGCIECGAIVGVQGRVQLPSCEEVRVRERPAADGHLKTPGIIKHT